MAAALLDSDAVLAVDCDSSALEVAKENARRLELDEDVFEFVLGRIRPTNSSSQQRQKLRGYPKGRHPSAGRSTAAKQQSTPIAPPSLQSDAPDGLGLRSKCVDCVITNPPFGTKNNAGMDVRFLQTAVRLARRAVYSFHKTSTRDYLQKLVTREWKLQFSVVAEMKFDIGQTYKFHKEKSRDIAVDLIRIDMDALIDDNDVSVHDE
jgi:predicted RNA methylase